MRILIYDVETAQTKNIGTICSVGWILLENDSIINEGYSLINPHCSFSRVNTQIHGITAADVVESPSFAEYWESTLCSLMTTSLVIAHSANFDLSATEQALFDAGITDPGIYYMDSLPVLRTFISFPSYKLIDLAKETHFEYNPHNAAEDVHALLHVLCFARDLCNFEDLPAMLIRSSVRAENTKTNAYIAKHIVYRHNPFPIHTHCTDDIKTIDCCLQNMKVCITGDIPGYERSDIERMILEHGGKPSGGVSGKTDYLIVGTYCDPATGNPIITSKYQKALDLIEQGGKIQIISFDNFLEIINQKQK